MHSHTQPSRNQVGCDFTKSKPPKNIFNCRNAGLEKGLNAWRCGLADGSTVRTPKGCSFNSQSGHMSRLRVPSPVRVHARGSRLMMFFSHPCFSLSLPSSIKNQLKKKKRTQRGPQNAQVGSPRHLPLFFCSEQTPGRGQACGLWGRLKSLGNAGPAHCLPACLPGFFSG